MAKFCLTTENAAASPHLRRLLEELMSTKDQPVFRIYVPTEPLGTILCTTNEKVHLAFGKLSSFSLEALAHLFREKTGADSELIFTFEPKEGEPVARSLYVTASHDHEARKVFHLSIGH